MNTLENAENQLPFRVDSPQPDTGGLLRTGVFSLLLHLALISFLIFNLKTGTTRDKLPVYRVSIQPLSLQNDSKPLLPKAAPIPAKPQIQKEEIRPKEEAKKSEPVKEPKQLSQLKEDDQAIQKPIPLPMAETSTVNTDSKPDEEIPSIPKDASAKSGTGTGTGASPGGSGGGEAGGGAGWTGIGKGTGVERGGGVRLWRIGFCRLGKRVGNWKRAWSGRFGYRLTQVCTESQTSLSSGGQGQRIPRDSSIEGGGSSRWPGR